MVDEALPRKRKNDEYRESFLTALFRFLWRATRFSFKIFIITPIRWLWQAAVWTFKAPFRLLGWLLRGLNVLINGRMPEFETAREREIYRRIRRRYRRRSRFITHLFAFVFINGLLWFAWLSRPYQSAASYIAITLVWAFFFCFHYFRFRLGDAEDDALEAALEREYEREARGQPIYYEEWEEYYGDESSYRHLTDDSAPDDRRVEVAKAKRRNSYS